MAAVEHAEQRAAVRRALAWALATALCVAALTAIVAILSDDFDDTDWQVIGSSLGFAIFSATAASGVSLRYRPSASMRALAIATVAASAAAYGLWLWAIWTDPAEDGVWQWFGCVALVALTCSHASVVSGSIRRTDSGPVVTTAAVSMALAVVDSFAGILAIAGAVDDAGEGYVRLMAVLVVLLLLTTALPPVLRRVQRPQPAAPTGRGSPRVPSRPLRRSRRRCSPPPTGSRP